MSLALAIGWAGACASASNRDSAADSAGAVIGGHGPSTGDSIAVLVVVPARVGGARTAVVAARALQGSRWAVASLDTAGNALESHWMAFRHGPGECSVRLRLLVFPVKDSPTTVELGLQVWLLQRMGASAAMAYGRSLFAAFQQDVVSATPDGRGARSRLQDELNRSGATGEFVLCGRVNDSEI